MTGSGRRFGARLHSGRDRSRQLCDNRSTTDLIKRLISESNPCKQTRCCDCGNKHLKRSLVSRAFKHSRLEVLRSSFRQGNISRFGEYSVARRSFTFRRGYQSHSRKDRSVEHMKGENLPIVVSTETMDTAAMDGPDSHWQQVVERRSFLKGSVTV
jgi:hypothetical protein